MNADAAEHCGRTALREIEIAGRNQREVVESHNDRRRIVGGVCIDC
jgi:hypothetical protein